MERAWAVLCSVWAPVAMLGQPCSWYPALYEMRGEQRNATHVSPSGRPQSQEKAYPCLCPKGVTAAVQGQGVPRVPEEFLPQQIEGSRACSLHQHSLHQLRSMPPSHSASRPCSGCERTPRSSRQVSRNLPQAGANYKPSVCALRNVAGRADLQATFALNETLNNTRVTTALQLP